jgi:hypothetical protein
VPTSLHRPLTANARFPAAARPQPVRAPPRATRAREHPGRSRAYLGVGYAANFTFGLKSDSPLQLNRTQPKSNLSAERFCRGL